jgi:UDP-N-acetyl-D-glucosamine dehydrogenase
VELTAAEAARHDCVVVLTNHTAFDYPLLVHSAPLIVDTRDALRGHRAPHVFRLGAPRHTGAGTAREAVV